MAALRLALIATLLAVALAFGPSPPSAHAVDYDCDNFSTQAEAQGYLSAGDPYRLDGDNDGIACESLPCPCSYGAPSPPPAPTPVIPSPSPPPLPEPAPEEEPLRFTAYVACGLSRYAPRARECSHRGRIGAFFRANREVTYDLCITFPLGRRTCIYEQAAAAGVLYVNKVTSSSFGRHKVTWLAGGASVTRYFWRYY